MLPVPRQPSTVAPTPTFASNPFRVPANGRSSPFDARPYTYAPRYSPRYDGRSRPLRPYGYPYGYGYAYGYYGYAAAPIYGPNDVNVGVVPYREAATAPDSTESLGRLFIDTEPGTAQVVVDGRAVGSVADFRGVGMLLPEGVRHVDLRAPGYEDANFDIDILSSQPAVYRGDLTAVRRATGPAAAPIRRGSDTFYVIPDCYLGNRPPSEVSLPPGCDLKKTRTIK
jgi:PEGA domain-containing protein